MFADATHFPEADVNAPGGAGPEIPALSDGPEADILRSASNRLQLINPAHWPTNTYGIPAQYDDAAECFRLTPPHEWDADEIPYSVIKGKGKGSKIDGSAGKGKGPAPLPDLLPKGERKVKESTPDEMAKFSNVADVLSWAKIPGVATWRGSAAGRLLDLLGCADVEDGLADISEFASIEPETLDEAITKWTFSKFKSPVAFTESASKEADDVDSDGDLTESPKAMVIARAKMVHNAARLASGITWSK